jgi:dolichol-phosphate mannosyltransferase
VRTLVVTPTYLEADNIAEALRRVRAAVPEASVLVVDDNSPDGTGDLAEQAARELGAIEVLHQPFKNGLGNAYRAGFAIGMEQGYEILVQMDADLSHDAAQLPSLLERVEAGADLAIGSRYVPGGSIPHWPAHRRAMSKYGNLYATAVLGLGVNDATSGYRAYRADILKTIDYASTRAAGYGFQIELAYRVALAGGSIEQVPITFTDRVRGQSKMTLSIAAEELLLVSWWGLRDRVLTRGRRLRPGQGTATPAP